MSEDSSCSQDIGKSSHGTFSDAMPRYRRINRFYTFRLRLSKCDVTEEYCEFHGQITEQTSGY